MTPPLLLDSISLRAFRGVRDELKPLDLTSPITLIYAPNGTGKTSLIDAAEWLLTGNVYRLFEMDKKGRSKIEPDELRCQTSPQDLVQEVWGQLQLGGEIATLSRVADGCTENGVRITENKLMEMFAPNAVGENVPHQSKPRLQRNWIRGARFLTEATLSTLVDTDKDSEDSRQEIMADMLGVRELNERAKKFTDYANYLKSHSSGIGISSLKKELDKKLEYLEELSPPSNDHPTETSSAKEVVNDELYGAIISLKSVGIEVLLPSTGDAESIIAAISAAYSSETEKFRVQKISLNKVLASWMEIDGFRSELEKKKHEQQSLSELVSEMESTVPKLAAQTAALQKGIEQSEDEKNRIYSLHLNFGNSLEALIRAIRTVADADIPAPSITTVMDLEGLPETSWSEKRLADLFLETNNISDDLEAFDADLNCLAAARLELSALNETPIAKRSLPDLEKEVALHENEVNDLSKAYADQSGPVDDLRLSVSRFLDAAGEDSNCPACGHQWDNNDALLNALERTADQVPKHMQRLSANLLQVEKKHNEAKRIFVEAKKIQKSISLKAGEIRVKEKSVDTFLRQVKELSSNWGGEGPTPDKQSISAHLVNIKNRINFGTVSIGFFADLRHICQVLNNLEIPKKPIKSLSNYYKQIAAQHQQSLDEKISKNTPALSKLNSQLAQKTSELEQNNSLLIAVRERVSELVPLVENFSNSWEQLGGSDKITDAELAAIKERLETRTIALAEAHQHLSAAQAAHESIAAEKKAAEISREILFLEDKINSLEKKRSRAAKASQELEDFSNSYIHRQFNKLSKVFWPIFWRLQANEFYESIKPGPPEAPLRWMARAMGRDFDPTKHFSMGQRQDFALAIFLARARSLGGTFFLDEPIIHLDDLNRVSLLDLFRLMAVEPNRQSRFVITTASKSLVRHMKEKFASVPRQSDIKPIRIYGFDGSPRAGIEVGEL